MRVIRRSRYAPCFVFTSENCTGMVLLNLSILIFSTCNRCFTFCTMVSCASITRA
jgi:hypothetical protein